MRFLMYLNSNGKLLFTDVWFNGTMYGFKEINEPHLLAGFYENGVKKAITHSKLTEFEIYAMHNDIDLQTVSPSDFHPAGRKFVWKLEDVKTPEVTISKVLDGSVSGGNGSSASPIDLSILKNTQLHTLEFAQNVLDAEQKSWVTNKLITSDLSQLSFGFHFGKIVRNGTIPNVDELKTGITMNTDSNSVFPLPVGQSYEGLFYNAIITDNNGVRTFPNNVFTFYGFKIYDPV